MADWSRLMLLGVFNFLECEVDICSMLSIIAQKLVNFTEHTAYFDLMLENSFGESV